MARINAVSFHETTSIEAICRTVQGAGFDSLELSRPLFYQKLTTPGLRRRFATWAEELGLSLYGFDCWVDVDPFTRFEETLADFNRAIEWAADLNLGMIITHDPWLSVNGHRKPSECLQTNVALFRLVAALCVEHNLRLMIEPHPDTLSIGNAWACDLIDAVNAELPASPVGILYDCCHYGVGQPKTYASAIDALGTRVNHIHFSDGDAQTYALHLPLGDGCLQLDEIVAALKTSNYCGTLTNDLYNYPLLEDGARRNAPKIRDLEAQLGISSARDHA